MPFRLKYAFTARTHSSWMQAGSTNSAFEEFPRYVAMVENTRNIANLSRFQVLDQPQCQIVAPCTEQLSPEGSALAKNRAEARKTTQVVMAQQKVQVEIRLEFRRVVHARAIIKNLELVLVGINQSSQAILCRRHRMEQGIGCRRSPHFRNPTASPEHYSIAGPNSIRSREFANGWFDPQGSILV